MTATNLTNPAYLIGIDGGQTSTTCLLTDTEGTILGRGLGGHLVHLSHPDGEHLMRAAFQQCVGQAWQAAGLSPRPCLAAYLGLSGVEAGTPEAQKATQIAAEVITAQTIIAANDATSALAGALLGKPGVVVVAGTGSIAFGVNEKGEEQRSGGWGWLLGDEGSAVYVGHRGLLAAIRCWDGRGPATLLLDRFRHHYRLSDFYGLKRLIYSSQLDARLFADLAPLVVDVAQQGDPVARQILEEAAKELACLASAAIRKLNFVSTSVPVAPIGGMFQAGPLILRPFARFLRRREPRASVVKPALPAVCGSVILALRACGLLTDHTLHRLQEQTKERGWSHVE